MSPYALLVPFHDMLGICVPVIPHGLNNPPTVEALVAMRSEGASRMVHTATTAATG